MGKAPAVVIIARHGARLDAEDKNWVTSSPTPYDSPLSYGGWTQSRALGARIAGLLHARDIALNDNDTPSRSWGLEDAATEQSGKLEDLQHTSKPRRRKHKIIIHSSPFLRCIQTSIAVSAGIAQCRSNSTRLEAHNRLSTPVAPHLFTVSPRSRTLDTKTFGSTSSESNSVSNLSASKTPFRFEPIDKITLRIDAFLGEWLSPDYFEFITAPPPSNMMVAAAKAELLRSAEPIQGSRSLQVEPRSIFLSGGWGQYQDFASTNIHSLSMAQVAQALPGHGMSSNGNLESGTAGIGASKANHSSRAKPVVSGYLPPAPTYALLPKEPIPSGYVAHARDACINIDFQWDSMREPQNWGDGGEHGEEWSAMHMRFRRGMFNMITWYREEGPDYDPQDNDSHEDASKELGEVVDTVLVIVTHGAGCNALIGAMTGQPVLLDVGMGSLTMAMRKDRVATQSSCAPSYGYPSRPRKSSVDLGFYDEYDMKIVASTDHLRAGADPLHIPQLQSPKLMPLIPELRYGPDSLTSSGATAPAQLDKPHIRTKNAALGSIRRFRAIAKSVPSKSITAGDITTSPLTSSGLWGSRKSTMENLNEAPSSHGRDMTLNFNDGASDVRQTRLSRDEEWSQGSSASLEEATTKQGLWAPSSRIPPVRRWTVHEND